MKQNKEEYNEHEVQQEIPSILSKQKILLGDRVLWVILAMFFAISMVVVYSASSQLGFREGSTSIYLKKHIVTIGFSIGIVALFYLFKARWLRKFTMLAYIGSLLATIVPYFQAPINGAHRWLDLGFFMFQSSELLKIATIMLLAAQLSSKHHIIKKIHLLPTTFNVRKWFSKEELEVIRTEIIPILSSTFLRMVSWRF